MDELLALRSADEPAPVLTKALGTNSPRSKRSLSTCCFFAFLPPRLFLAGRSSLKFPLMQHNAPWNPANPLPQPAPNAEDEGADERDG